MKFWYLIIVPFYHWSWHISLQILGIACHKLPACCNNYTYRLAFYGLNCKNDSTALQRRKWHLKRSAFCIFDSWVMSFLFTSSSCPIMVYTHRLIRSLQSLLLECCTACVHRQGENKIHTRSSSLSPRYCAATAHCGCSLVLFGKWRLRI